MKIRFLLSLFIVFCCVSNAFGLQRDTTYKFGDFLIDATGPMRIDFIVKGKGFKQRTSKGDTLYEDNKYLILGDADLVRGQGV